ncbi:MAG: hypothetical protein QOC94_4941 [Actinoplanes sp.]|nr:hypothetical protein [Actinoplanes sp.]
MTYSVHDGQDLERALRTLRQRVGELGDEIEETQSRHRSLDAQVDGIDDRVGALERTQQELEETQEGLHESMDSTAAAVRSLAATVGWIERRLHTERDIPAADVDTADDVLRQLATRARQGQQSAAVLLDESARARHQRQIDDLTRLEQQIRETVAAALQHSATLATTEPGSAGHVRAATQYRALARALAGYQGQLPAARKAAESARQALKIDDEHRQVHGPQVMTGESAHTQLMTRVRDRLDTAVADSALLPAWLTLVLGHQPVGEDVDKWMNTATSLLAYRVTYEVVDPVVALGEPTHDDPRREKWHRDLGRRLASRRHWPI